MKRALRRGWRKLLGSLPGRSADEELAEELNAHLDMLIADNIERGIPPERARREAVLTLGKMPSIRDRYQEQNGLAWLACAFRDFRYGLRGMARNPGFTAIAVLTLAIGIGASTAIFTLTNRVLLRPLPFPDPERLVAVWGYHPGIGLEEFSMPDYMDVQKSARSYEQLGAVAGLQLPLVWQGRAEVIDGAQVTGNFFSTLGVAPQLGRGIEAGDGPGSAVVLSHTLWQTRFGGDPKVLGTAITLQGSAHTVVGVMPSDFRLPPSAEAWVPLTLKSLQNSRRGDFLFVTGRLRKGVTKEAAQAELVTLMSGLASAYPNTNAGWSGRVEDLHEQLVGEVRKPLLLLFGAVGLLLLIGCANVANLLLSRGEVRHKELVVRIALGAGRRRLVLQLLSESLALSVAGGCLGAFFAWAGVVLLVGGSPTLLPRMDTVRVDLSALGFALLLSIVTGLLFGLLPARAAARINVGGGLKSAGRGAVAGGRDRAMRVLVAAEVALALTLLVGAGLLTRSFHALTTVDPGFRAEHILAARVSVPSGLFGNGTTLAAFYDEVLRQVRALPGVQDAAVATMPPHRGGNYMAFAIQGRPPIPADTVQDANLRAISPGYLRTLQIPLLIGREFSDRDTSSAPLVGLVNAAFAKRYFPNQDALGQQLSTDGKAWRTIVGVIGNVKHDGVQRPDREEMLVPLAQRAGAGMTILVRTTGSPESLAGAVRGVVTSVNSQVPIARMGPLTEWMDDAFTQARFRTYMLNAFAVVSMLLAALGVFGVVSYSVKRRTPEIGVRMALGASPAAVLRMVLESGLGMTAVGIGFGLLGSLLLSRVLGELLFGVTPTDFFSFLGASGVLTGAALVACYLPARRATKVDPVVALRLE